MAEIQISKIERGYELCCEQFLPRGVEEVFPFFADAGNLQAITPSNLRFQILTPPDELRMREGLLIDYRLRLRGIPARWRTKISAWDPPHRFVDEQLRGPYRWWIHEHTFEEREGGTLVRDRVRYHTWLAPLLHPIFIRRDLRAIFAYRSEKLRERFGSDASSQLQSGPYVASSNPRSA